MKSLKPLSIYLHIPFCEKRCPYCDFHSSVGGDIGKYIERICEDIKNPRRFATPPLQKVNTIYIGGGTPSLLSELQVEELFKTLRANFNVDKDAEISIECNPCSLTESKLQAYRRVGINRVSIGVQSFCDKGLKVLGRLHDVKKAKTAIKLACKYFDNVSIDLMHSVPGVKPKLPRKYLKMVQHVSAYCLTSDKYPQIDDKQSIKQQTKIERVLKKCGLEKYEVSNFAKKGYECRHNLVYWECGEWLGIGEGAESHLGEWQTADKVMLGLRLVRGVPVEWLCDKQGIVDDFVERGLLQIQDGRVSCTAGGFLVLNQILIELC